MTLATQDAPQTQLMRPEREVEYIPFGAKDKIKLSVSVIRNIIATPTREGELPDDRECMKFMMLCRAGHLNPFAGDAFLIGFFDRSSGAVKWSMITSIHAFYKRAESHPEYDGIQSGVIVRDGNQNVVDRIGDFTFEDDTLIGSWAIVHFKSRTHPMSKRMKLATYKKEFGVWKSDPAGMICKVAEAHALRDSFPTLLGGFYLREEAEASQSPPSTPKVEHTVIERPAKPFGPQEVAVTQRPVSEGQTFEPDPDVAAKAKAEAAIAAAPRATESKMVNPPDLENAKPGDTVRFETEVTADLTTVEGFNVAMSVLAEEAGKDKAAYDKAMSKVALAEPVQRANSTGLAARKRIYDAAAHGAFDWETGTIVG